MTATPSLHEQRRRSTREALRRAALASFAARGFANVTVTELARAAGVTERTFFRHFPTKEAVLFQDYETQVEWLAAALARRPGSESVFDAVRAAIAEFPYDLEVVRQAATARSELISAERIAGHLRVVQSSFADVLTGHIRTRYAGTADIDLVADVAGAALAAALVVAVEHWGRNGCVDDLGEITSASMAVLRSGFARLT
ncbi:TetR family transcriptional regulator [Mycolicibacterium vanbaalenii]|uniref:Transcriptional regulator, TetR family n=1 Tax=Mycolicibacterium vanbaalenii (strain DSM 7251 / JCM 13017 / BCRC 16820 / KCTC 9966 / NRRL B-24157 / PYR-1) TaxID=350058 RepID=A1T3S7_MYCVP|nr:TetR family transcriptional regulator [Mycolicibacterium vanbaalenii]ABM11827.1 transcriptional regulator, TetR family [Mycolicibacterium vanbaalenii PYR-1]MCV7127940.1 TetR family transcriptional regulator [Mycolicibacterium vanbaalenii PYR-1]